MNKKTLIIAGSSIIGLLVALMLVLYLITILKPRYYSYEKAEELIKTAVDTYYKKNPAMLPSEDGSYNLDYSVLVEGEYIKPLNEILKDGDSCTIQISVNKKELVYSYIPYLNCGDNYQTIELYKKIINDNEVITTGSGLYQDTEGNYYFRGKVKNNYVSFGIIEDGKDTEPRIWRIIGVDSNNNIKLRSTQPTEIKTAWDDRYNAEEKSYVGYNDFENSVIKERLIELYDENIIFRDEEKTKLTATNLCIGSRKLEDKSTDGKTECSVLTTDQYYFSTILPYEYMRASLDENCTGMKNNSCTNFNYLSETQKTEWVITNDASTNYTAYKFDGSRFESDKTKQVRILYVVINLNEYSFYKSGNGTEEDPYIIK